jgi:hypothetical protein
MVMVSVMRCGGAEAVNLPVPVVPVSVKGSGSGSGAEQCTYSFFFFTFRQPFAAKAVFDRVRLFYPTAPIVSD